MKLFYTYLFLTLSICVQAQSINIEDIFNPNLSNAVQRIFQNDLPEKSKFLNAKNWAAKNYGDYQKVCKLEDNDNYKLVIKGAQPILMMDYLVYSDDLKSKERLADVRFEYTLSIDCKEDRYRIKFTDLQLIGSKVLSDWSSGLLTVGWYDLPWPYKENIEIALNTDSATYKLKIEEAESNLKNAEKGQRNKLKDRLRTAQINYKTLPYRESAKVEVASFLSNTFKALKEAIEYNDDF